MKVEKLRTIYKHFECFLRGWHGYSLIGTHSLIYRDNQLVGITEEYKCIFCGNRKTLKL